MLLKLQPVGGSAIDGRAGTVGSLSIVLFNQSTDARTSIVSFSTEVCAVQMGDGQSARHAAEKLSPRHVHHSVRAMDKWRGCISPGTSRGYEGA